MNTLSRLYKTVLMICLFNLISIAQTIDFERKSNVLQTSSPWVIDIGDVNNDGYKDILAATYTKNIVLFKMNPDESFSKDTISAGVNLARNARLFDLDNDGSLDIISANYNNNTVKYWLNKGDYFEEKLLDSNFIQAHTVEPFDIDQDGDVDIVATAFNTIDGEDKLVWWENTGELNFVRHSLSTEFKSAVYVVVEDIDNDGDYDILANSESLGDISWWKNDGNQNFTKIRIDADNNPYHTVFPRDIDSDGDKDIIGCSYEASEVAWWENTGGEIFSKHIIGPSQGSIWVDAADLDNDGDMDIYNSSWTDCFWYENNGSQNFIKHTLDGGANACFALLASDIDGDNDLDLLAGARNEQEIKLWKNSYNNFDFSSNVLSGHSPITVTFSDNSVTRDKILEWQWDFNNDGIIDSYEQNPVYEFSSEGNYEISCTYKTGTFSKKVTKTNMIRVFNGQSSVSFEKDNSYVLIPAKDKINLANNFTVEFGFYADEWGKDITGTTLFDKGSVKVLQLGKGLGSIKTRSIQFLLVDSDNKSFKISTTENSYSLNKWSFLSFVYDTSIGLNVYINGISQELFFVGSNFIEKELLSNADKDIYIGNSPDFSKQFKGRIDEIRIWETARTESEISGNLNSPLNPDSEFRAYYQMNEGTGNEILDSKGAINGELVNVLYSTGLDFELLTDIKNSSIKQAGIASSFLLFQNFPNPFNPTTTIKYSVPSRVEGSGNISNVKLVVYDILGREIAVLINEAQSGGIYEIPFDATSLSSGIYFYKITVGNYSDARKMIFAK